MPQTTVANTTSASPPRPKTVEELRMMFWGNREGNRLLHKQRIDRNETIYTSQTHLRHTLR
jgi:hypothetical protein